MKRSRVKQQQEFELKRRLELVRTTIRELTPAQLEDIHGGTEANAVGEPNCPPRMSY